LNGAFKEQIASYQVIECRFDYEYHGGHVPGAININTTMQLEEYFLSDTAKKPIPSVWGRWPKARPCLPLRVQCQMCANLVRSFLNSELSFSPTYTFVSVQSTCARRIVPLITTIILEGGYCQYFKESVACCETPGYVRMDDPNHAASRKEELDHFHKAKFGRTKSYT
jgi:M-phase inducer tyrosine phosphatase